MLVSCLQLICFAENGNNTNIKRLYYNYLVQNQNLAEPFDANKIVYSEYGIYNGYRIALFYDTYFNYPCVMKELTVAGYVFWLDSSVNIFAYMDNQFYTLESLYAKNALSRSDIGDVFIKSNGNLIYDYENEHPFLDSSLDYVCTELADGSLRILKHFTFSKKNKNVRITVPSEIDGRAVTSLAYSSFQVYSELTDMICKFFIYIPDSVTQIDISAFPDYNTVVYGSKGSYAEQFVKEYNEKIANTMEFREYGTFPDVTEGSWFYDAVNYNFWNGYMAGFSNGNFGPRMKIQRQDFAIILAKLAGYNAPSIYNSNPFKDAAFSSYYYPYLSWAYENDMIHGYEDGNFGVGDAITREQLCTIVYRYCGSQNLDNAEEILADYTDRDEISEYAVTAMAWCVENGVIHGTTDTTLSPLSNASRAEVATIIMRACENGLV